MRKLHAVVVVSIFAGISAYAQTPAPAGPAWTTLEAERPALRH